MSAIKRQTSLLTFPLNLSWKLTALTSKNCITVWIFLISTVFLGFSASFADCPNWQPADCVGPALTCGGGLGWSNPQGALWGVTPAAVDWGSGHQLILKDFDFSGCGHNTVITSAWIFTTALLQNGACLRVTAIKGGQTLNSATWGAPQDEWDCFQLPLLGSHSWSKYETDDFFVIIEEDDFYPGCLSTNSVLSVEDVLLGVNLRTFVPTNTPTRTPTRTRIPSNTPTRTPTPIPTNTATPSPSLTSTPCVLYVGPGYAYQCITDALADAYSGCTIYVADSNYTTAHGEVFPLRMKSGVNIIREDPFTFPHIIGDQYSSVIHAAGFYDYDTILDGFWLSGGGRLNVYGIEGGGIYCSDVNFSIVNCIISGNKAHLGGGICCSNASPRIINSIIANNSVNFVGGGLECDTYSNPKVTNCTFSGNQAALSIPWGGGGGIYCYDLSNPTVTNCIIWDNTPDEISLGQGVNVVTYCDIKGGLTGLGNIDADPFFADPMNLDYHLRWNSPCIDQGTTHNSPVTDFENDIRPCYSGIDIGADEYCGPILTDTPTPTFTRTSTPTPTLTQTRIPTSTPTRTQIVTPTWTVTPTYTPTFTPTTGSVCEIFVGHGHFSGSHWVPYYRQYDYNTITLALDNATAPCTIWVADSNYTSAYGEYFPLRMKAGVSLIHRDPYDPSSRANIIGDQNSTVIYASGFRDYDTRLVGFKISNGLGYLSQLRRGGGIYCNRTDFTIANCIITRNSQGSSTCTSNNCTHSGGGIYCYDSSPDIIGCTISHNRVYFGGSGIACYSGSNPIIRDCVFQYNTGRDFYAEVVKCYYGSPELYDCTITDNSDTAIYAQSSYIKLDRCAISRNGGGLYCYASSPILTNCFITDNIIPHDAAIWCHHRNNLDIINCTISGNVNSSGYGSGGLECCSENNLRLKNCIFWGNSPNPEIYISSHGSNNNIVVSYCDIEDCVGIPECSSDTSNIDCYPSFVGSGDYHLTSPGSCCIDMGTNYGVPAYDIDIEIRPNPDTGQADIGADEFYCPYQTLATQANPERDLTWHTEVLRNFRDEYLSQSEFGRKLIIFYYAHGHEIARIIQNDPGLIEKCDRLVNTLANEHSDFYNLNLINSSDYAELNQIDRYDSQATSQNSTTLLNSINLLAEILNESMNSAEKSPDLNMFWSDEVISRQFVMLFGEIYSKSSPSLQSSLADLIEDMHLLQGSAIEGFALGRR